MIETKFKQTEAGLLPEDWEARLVSKSFSFIGNNTCARELMRETGTVHNIHYGDILIKYGAIVDITKEKVPYLCESVRSFAKNPLQDGDVLMADTAEDETVGKCCEVIGVNNKQAETGLHSFGLRPNDKYAPKFLGYAFNSSLYHDQLLPHIQGTKVSSVSKASVGKTYLCCPKDENEQRRIANVLSDIDDLISTFSKLIEKKNNITTATMQQLLSGKKRLSRFSEEWIEMELGAIGNLAMCKRIFQDETSETGDVPFYKIGTFGKEPDAYISWEKYETFKRMYRYPQKGDVLISAAGTIGRTVIFDGEPSYFQDSNIVWLAHDEKIILNRFLYYVYKCIVWNTENTTIARLYNENFNKTSIKFPKNKEEQEAIATVLSDMDNEITQLESRKKKYEAIKLGMMQQLLTGKIRLV